MNSNQVYIGFITHGKATAKYLPYFLPSLKLQSYQDFTIFAIDNSEVEDNENRTFIKNNYPEVEFKWAGKNLGFAAAYNLMINRAISRGAKYFLAINPDIILDNNMLSEMIKVMTADNKISAIAPKILRWDFIGNKKSNIIDSCGIFITKGHRFSDANQGQIDQGEVTEPSEVFGFSAAAVLLRLEALPDTAFNNGKFLEFFDELMFMYKEDCDLSYRLRLAGWKIIFAPQAICYHDRSVSPKGESSLQIAFNRFHKSRQLKEWSFLHHWILLLKYQDLPWSWPVKLATFWYQLKSTIFAFILEPYLIKKLWKLRDLKGEITKRREQLKLRIDINEIERFMK